MIYLDYSANTPTDELVLSRFCEVVRDYSGNANSKHKSGYEAAKLQNKISLNIAGMLGILPEEIIYTSGASESNNLAITSIHKVHLDTFSGYKTNGETHCFLDNYE